MPRARGAGAAPALVRDLLGTESMADLLRAGKDFSPAAARFRCERGTLSAMVAVSLLFGRYVGIRSYQLGASCIVCSLLFMERKIFYKRFFLRLVKGSAMSMIPPGFKLRRTAWDDPVLHQISHARVATISHSDPFTQKRVRARALKSFCGQLRYLFEIGPSVIPHENSSNGGKCDNDQATQTN